MRIPTVHDQRAPRLGTWSFLAAACLATVTTVNAQTISIPVPAPATSVAVLVEFQGEPAARSYAQSRQMAQKAASGNARVDAAALKAVTVKSARDQIARNEQEQEAFEAALAERLGAARGGPARPEVIYRVTKALNGIAYRVDPSMVESLRAMPGVKRVRVMELEYPNLSRSVPALGTSQAWAGVNPLGVTGQGVRLGIIDSGVDYQHATFGGTGLQADYEDNNLTDAPDAFFPNLRVVGGTDLAGDGYDGGNSALPDPDPMDCNGHGTHVASIAAGGGVNANGTPYSGPYDASTPSASMRLGPGMAPEASIYAIRVFGCKGGTNLVAQGIEWALDPDRDGDLSDHLDVVNLSLGSPFGRLTSESAEAADNAASMGIVMVLSAGNDGDTYTIGGSPASASQGLSVAAVGHDVRLEVHSPASLAGQYSAAETSMVDDNGFMILVSGQSGDVVLATDAADIEGPTTTDGCSAYTNAAAVSGKIAMVDRGSCQFSLKYQMARAAGAIGLIIANNVAGAPTPIGGGPIPGIASIPVLSITQSDGNSIKSSLAANEVVNVSLGRIFTGASFSSRGPRAGLDGVKPDIAAPGVAISAAKSGAGSQNVSMSGTSMAAPHVAGMMALLKQRFPGSSVADLKAMAMNTALHDVFDTSAQRNRFGVDLIGAGVIDPVRALQNTVTAVNEDEPEAVGLAFFGEVVGSDTRTKRLRLINHGSTDQTFALGLDIANDAPGMEFLLPGGNTVTVPAGGSVSVEVQVRSTAAQMNHVRDATAAPAQGVGNTPFTSWGVRYRSYLTNKSGYITLSQGDEVKVRAPVYAALRPASVMKASTPIVTGGVNTGTLSLALTGQDVCTGTLVPGSTCTGALPATDTSLVTPFEWQVDAPVNPAIVPYANIKQAGVSFDGTQLLFGISTWGDWGSLNDVAVNLIIDGNNDGVWDYVVMSSNIGSIASNLFSQNVSEHDAFVTARYSLNAPPGQYGQVFMPSTYINGQAGNQSNTVVFGSNALFMPVIPAQVGITPGIRFAYKIVTCLGRQPLCSVSGFGTQLDEAAGPYTWNTAAQGLDFGSTGARTPDLNGGSLPLSWNQTHLATNKSLGAMLIHHHNVQGQRVQTLPVVNAMSADLAVEQLITPVDPLQGQNVTLALTARNLGGYDATGVNVQALLPAGMSYLSDNSGGAYNPSTGVWTVGVLANGASASLTVSAQASAVGALVMTSTISATETDPAIANNSVATTLNVKVQPPVQTSTSFTLANALVTASPVLSGSAARFVLTLNNTGTVALQNASIAALVDFVALKQALTKSTSSQISKQMAVWSPDVSVQSGVASAGSFDSVTGVWTLPSLDAGASQTLTLTLSAPAVSGQLTLTTTANAANASSATQSTVVQVSAPAGPGGPVDPSDPTEPVKAAVPVPTGSTLMLMLLTLAFAGMGAAQLRARSKR